MLSWQQQLAFPSMQSNQEGEGINIKKGRVICGTEF